MQKNGDFPSQGFQDTPPPPLQTPTKLFYCKAPLKIRQNYFIASTYVIQHACKLYNSARIVQLRTRPSQKIFHWKFKMLSIFSCSNGPQKHIGIKKNSNNCLLPLDLDPLFYNRGLQRSEKQENDHISLNLAQNEKIRSLYSLQI